MSWYRRQRVDRPPGSLVSVTLASAQRDTAIEHLDWNRQPAGH
jgi:hypothetical protein